MNPDKYPYRIDGKLKGEQDLTSLVASELPLLVVDRDRIIQAVNSAYLRVVGRRDPLQLLGACIFDVLPDNPDDRTASGVTNLDASFEVILRTGRPDLMKLQRYDVSQMNGSGFVRRFWLPVNGPWRDREGRVIGILHNLEDVTPVIEEVLGAVLGDDLEEHLSADVDLDTWLDRYLQPVGQVLNQRPTSLTVQHLRDAVRAQMVIEQARGVLAQRHGVGLGEAFDLLRAQARARKVRVDAVAFEIVRRSPRG